MGTLPDLSGDCIPRAAHLTMAVTMPRLQAGASAAWPADGRGQGRSHTAALLQSAAVQAATLTNASAIGNHNLDRSGCVPDRAAAVA